MMNPEGLAISKPTCYWLFNIVFVCSNTCGFHVCLVNPSMQIYNYFLSHATIFVNF